MKVIIIFAAICAVVLAESPLVEPQDSKYARIISSKFESDPNGYNYAFDQTDGTQKEEEGSLKSFGNDLSGITARGSSSYVGTDGRRYTINYVADENGFQPAGWIF